MKRTHWILGIAAVVVATACLDERNPTELDHVAPVNEPAADQLDDDAPFRMITGIKAKAMWMTDVMGIPTTEEEALVRLPEIRRLMVKHSIEQKRAEIENASGPRAGRLREGIRGLERTLEIMTSMDMPRTSAAADGANQCEGDPSITFAHTSLTVTPVESQGHLFIVSLSSHSTEEDVKHRVGNDIVIYNTQTGERYGEGWSGQGSFNCLVAALSTESTVVMDINNPDLDVLCAQASGDHQSWNGVGDRDNAITYNPDGCVSLGGNDADPNDGIVPFSTTGGKPKGTGN